ncbi:hypothetical protein [Acinetobacter baumannii]|nr:hypothetical protein [Acinetobacter baumannii]OQY61306.1 Aromatic amino acid transport protein AroP [Acinetobacter baumannii]
MPIHTEHDPRLKSTLKTRHISMLALGGERWFHLFEQLKAYL